jgi:CHAD domain-containing protein
MNDKPSLQPDLAVGEALRTIARTILADARAAIEDPARPDAEAVHRFRREMKRWRAFLRLLRPFLDDGEDLRIEARNLARALGGARNAQSALDAINDLAGSELKLSNQSLRTLRSRIEQIRRTAETTALTGDMRVQITQALDRAMTAVEHWPFIT